MNDVNILTSIIERREDGFMTFSLNGEPHAAAIVNAVAANYHRLSGRPEPTEELLDEKVGEKVTWIRKGENLLGAGAITALEGKLFIGQRGIGILPKGARKKGFSITLEHTLDILDGYAADEAVELVTKVKENYPELAPLTQERLEQLPGEGESGDPEAGDQMCTLAVFGTYPAPGGTSSDALWMIGEYWPEDDICDTNVLLIRPEHGFSEYGSIYGRQLLTMPVGEVVGFTPISFRDAVGLCGIDYNEAIGIALSNVRPAGALAQA